MTRYQLASFIALSGLLLASVVGHAQQTSYDFLIAGARIVDGTGSPWFIGDIGIVGDHIAAIGDLQHAAAKQRIDAMGLVAAPGFIDVQGQSEFNVLVDNRAASKITQGVTTEITGEGTSIAPLNDRMLADLQDRSPLLQDLHLIDLFGGATGISQTLSSVLAQALGAASLLLSVFGGFVNVLFVLFMALYMTVDGEKILDYVI